MCCVILSTLVGVLVVSPLLAEDGVDSWTIPVRTLSGHTKPITLMVISPDGNFLATSSHDETLRIWNLRTGRAHATFSGYGSGSRAMTFSADGSLLAVAHRDHTVRLWDVVAKKEMLTLQGVSETRAIAFSPDGHTLATATVDKKLQLWETSSGKKIADLGGHDKWVRELRFSPDGRFLVSRGWDDLKVWNRNGSSSRTFEGTVSAITFSEDGKTLIFGTSHKLTRWKLEKDSKPQVVTGIDWKKDDDIYGDNEGFLSPHGDLLISFRKDLASGTLGGAPVPFGEERCQVLVLDAKTGKEQILSEQRQLDNWIRFVAYSPDGRTLAVYHRDKTISLVDAINGYSKVRLRAPGTDPFRNLLFSPDSKTLITSHGPIVTIWKVP